jgi:arabinofuranosyltransferase
MGRQDRIRILAIAGALVIFGASVLKLAWVCDDAFITFRTIDNFVNGYGLRWNIAERVQTFTHPLWLMVLTPVYAVFGHVFYAVIGVSLVLGLSVVWLTTTRFADHWLKVLWVGIAFAVSKAFAEYSTSGLENPLTHLLLVVFLCVYFLTPHSSRRLLFLSLLAGLLCLNRLDCLMMIAPVLAYEVWRGGLRPSWRPLVFGLAPLAVWSLFSTFYYGTPLPNTAYAKLGTGISRAAAFDLGVSYYTSSLLLDPVTLCTIGAALMLVAVTRQRDECVVAVGVVFSGLYIVWIGGDFMSGRFFTASYLVAVVLVCRLMPARPALLGGALAATVILGSVSPVSPLRVRAASYEGDLAISTDGIVDERGFYAGDCGLWAVIENGGEIRHVFANLGRKWKAMNPEVAMNETLGFAGYFIGPDVHLVGRFGLSDAFLARLPASGFEWRPGHYTRSFPQGYVGTLWKDENRIEDTNLAAFYDKISLVVGADLFSPGRLSALVGLNLGSYEYLVAHLDERYRMMREATWAEVESEVGVTHESDVDTLLDAADGFLLSGRSDLAYLVWSTAFEREPDAAYVLEVCNRICLDLIVTDAGMLATETLIRVTKEGRGGSDLQHTLAIGHFQQAKFGRAAEAARPGITSEPLHLSSVKVVADLLRIFRMPEAAGYYRAVLSLDPDNEEARTELSMIESEAERSAN